MNKLYKISGALMLTVGVTASGWAANACMPIAKACMSQGYYKGGNKEGKGLIDNCVKPVVAGEMTLPNTSFSNDVMQQCKAEIMAKMQSKSAQ